MAEPLVVADALRLPLSGGLAGVAARHLARGSSPARSRSSPGVSGSREVHAAARLLRARPALPRGRGERRAVASAASTCATTGPGELAAVCGTVFQEPETQVVMGGVRAELELPLEHRGEPAGSVARAVEETALGLGVAHLLERRTDTLSGGELQRVAIAAAMVHDPPLLRPGRADLPARPRGRRRARLAAAAAERGLGNRGRRGGAPAGALPAGRRPRDRDGGRPRGVRRRPREFLDWAARGRPGAGNPGRAPLLARGAQAVAGIGEGGPRRPARGEPPDDVA